MCTRLKKLKKLLIKINKTDWSLKTRKTKTFARQFRKIKKLKKTNENGFKVKCPKTCKDKSYFTRNQKQNFRSKY